MPARRPTLLLALALAAPVALAACGSQESSGSSSSAVLDGVTVTGTDPAKAPEVTVSPTPLTVTETTSEVLTEGKGPELTKTDIVKVNAAIVNAKDGKVVNSTWGSSPVGLDLGSADLFPSLKTTLPGTPVGSRVLVASPPKDAFGTSGNSDLGVGAQDSVLFVVDVIGATAPLPEAKGTAVAPKAGLPTVTMNPGKPATITIPPGAKAPPTLVVQPLVTGTGPEVKSGQTVRVAYTGALWRNGQVFDSSANNPDQPYFEFAIGGGQVIAGWEKGLVGQKVGSRVLLVVPPAEGYGSAGQGETIKGDDTLVFVVDILAAY
ncbi:MAG TPA: FKBP-type peptidyl-prolyl cis-trans isomerase [Dermatophilaceae bacterium]|nr:FKBP-type peptidyl-prolyl cis-trans isomerase [Dermatophilaceae bacterium]